MTAVCLAAAFAAGVLCGVLWREAYELLRRKDELMRLKAMTQRIRTLDALTLALVFSLLLCAGTGVSIIVNERGQSRLVGCFSRYNELAGNARDERNQATTTAAAAELAYVRQDLRYQQGLLDALEQGTPVSSLEGVIRVRIVANQRYLAKLTALQKVREKAPYPDPDFCRSPA